MVELGSEADAPGEEDVDALGPQTPSLTDTQDNRNPEEAHEQNSDEDAEGEEDDDEAGAIQSIPRSTRQKSRDSHFNEHINPEEHVRRLDAESASASDDESPLRSSGESDSSVENEWEAESDEAEEDGDAEIAQSNRCMYCGETEENDPSEEFEEYLGCTFCGVHAHRQCARDSNALTEGNVDHPWRCPVCEEQNLRVETDIHRQSSEDVEKRDTSEDPTNVNSRSLRKRKVSLSSEDELPQRAVRRRRTASMAQSPSPDIGSGLGSASPHRRRKVDKSLGARRLSEAPKSDRGSPDASAARPRRRDRHNATRKLVEVSTQRGGLLVLTFHLDPSRMQKILSARPRPSKRLNGDERRGRKKLHAPAVQEPEIPHYPPLPSNYNTAMLFAMNDREADENRAKPYGGILSEAEADTGKTFPQAEDRKQFEDARLRAEDDWKKRILAQEGSVEPLKPSQKVSGPPSKIKCINFGGFEIDTWHAAPYPEEYSRNKTLYICEFCLKYMNSDYVAWRHKLKCPAKHPPGDEIYRDGKYSFFEVDGRKNPVYCQNLCLLAKLFLGSKTLYYDVEPFLFYIMTENDEFGCHFVGYFSKEKRPSSLNNVSCILVLPIYQRRGFGHYLIDFSYLLTRVETKTGSPEKPLSDMGLVSYRGYWRLILCYQLLNQRLPMSIADLSDRTGMTADDIISALEGLRAMVRDPVTKTYALRVDHSYCRDYIKKYEMKGYPKVNPDALIWVPYVMNRDMERHFEDAPTLHTVAQREEDEREQHDEMGDRIDDASVDLLNGAGTPRHIGNKVPGISEASVADDCASPERQVSPRRTSPRRSPPQNSKFDRPQTPQILYGTCNGNNHNVPTPITSTKEIPPSRFEVYPPMPGTSARRRSGRPFGSRGRTRAGYSRGGSNTPIRRATSSLHHVMNGPGLEEDALNDNSRPESRNGIDPDNAGWLPEDGLDVEEAHYNASGALDNGSDHDRMADSGKVEKPSMAGAVETESMDVEGHNIDGEDAELNAEGEADA